MKTVIHGIMAVLLTLVAAGPALAQTVYVTDSLEITMRTEPDARKRIVRMLSSDTPLEVLGEQDGWLRVRTRDGREGWVLKRYTSSDTPKSVQIQRLTEQNEKLAALSGGAAAQLDALEEENSALKAELAQARSRLERLTGEYQALRADAAEVIDLKDSFAETSRSLEQATAEAESLRRENRELRSSANLQWFLSGAGVVFAAWLFGFIMGRIQRKRRPSLQF
ncbi:MAG: TIGR04211 family SH3 domain-containing protein [Desulfohalobiaceae bacterium]